jgi:hypothetical protein
MKTPHATAGQRSRGRALPIRRVTPKTNVYSRHMPQLDTILMVEETIRKNEVFETKNRLWRSLPKTMQYGTLLTILNYLQNSNKIVIEKDGTIIWTFVDTPEARKSLKQSKPL